VSGEVTDASNVTALAEKKLSDQVRQILDHYKQADPVGLPGAPIADPMPIPDMKHSFTYATMHFKSAHVRGLSRFRIQHIKSDLAAMQVCIWCSKFRTCTILLQNYADSSQQSYYIMKMSIYAIMAKARLNIEKRIKFSSW